MQGKNIYNEVRLLNESQLKKHNCVFISHKKEDSQYCRAIANYLMSIGIDVYFDEYDTTINRNNPASVVTAIERGLRSSNSVLCVFSQNTLSSKWVPWELGYAKCMPIPEAILMTKTIHKYQLPEYIQACRVLYSWNELLPYISKLPHNRSAYETIPDFNYLHPLYDFIRERDI